ncbi:efflux RND transporter permease subunit [Pseudonocardia ailaonensis]|uniref:Efflux RND transporter permease subunit n=1 Tax=Pseudonocardia ailaonensis TaxID=367279 RepID=A0ABN2N6K7_9PSEU
MTWLARLSLRNRALVGLVTVLLVAFGVISTTSLRQELFPSLDVPVATVLTPYTGASADVVEQQVTTPIEQAVRNLAGVTGSRSTSSGGSSVVTLDLEYGTDLDDVTSRLQRAVQGVSLPTGVTPQVVTGGIDSIPVVQLAVSSALPADRIAEILRNDVQPMLQGLDGVSAVTLSGLADQQVVVRLDPAAAAARGVSAASISSLLQANGVRVPAGQLSPDTNPLTVQVGSPITSAAQLADLYVTPGVAAGGAGGGSPGPGAAGSGAAGSGAAGSGAAAPVRLGDIATVTSQAAPATGYTRTNGAPSIGIGVTKTPDANTVTVSHEVRDAIGRISDALGGSAQNAQVTVVFDQAPFIEQSVHDLTVEGLLGLAFAVIVILVFLLSVRATLVTAVSIPLSVLIAMIVLDLGGYTLNILTLGALTVAIGRVVDDSIVVIENIKRHVGRGRPTPDVVVGAVREVAGAITASTITTVAVFAPIGLVGGQVGELFRPFAVTVTAALLASLVVSLTLVPVLASAVLRGKKRAAAGSREVAGAAAPGAPAVAPAEDEPVTRMQRAYVPVVRGAVRRPVVTILVALLILAGTFALVPRLTTNFLGDAGGNTVSVTQQMPPGTGLPRADAAARRVEDVVRGTAGVQSYQVTVGSSAGTFRPGSAGTTPTRFSITLADGSDATAVQDDLRTRLAALTDAGELTVAGGQGGLGGSDLQVDVHAADPQALAQAADQVQKAVAGIAGVTDVRNDLAAAQPSVDVQVDRQKAAAAGLTEAQVGQSVAAALRGTPIGTLTIDGVDESVVLRAGDPPADVPSLRSLPITTLRGPVPLSELATVTETSSAPTISHTDGTRSASITARPTGDDVGAASTTLQTTIDGLRLPAGATAEIGGVSTQQSDAFTQLFLALLAAVAVVYLVMVVTFRSLVQPLILLVSVPFAATGAIGLLVSTGTPLGVPALIGMLMLVGIVVTNAIVLIDLVNQYRRAGHSIRDAVLEGASRRLRPIVMTAVATIFALLPMSLGLTGGGVFISQPLAIVVIGGLISSTLLTLVLVPVLYSLVERARERLRGRRGEPAPALAGEPSAALAGESDTLVGGSDTAVAGEPDTALAGEPGPESLPASRASNSVGAAEPADGGAPAVPPAVPQGPGLHGIVAHPDGSPLAAATVVVFDQQGAQLGATVADAQGRYALGLPAAAEYLLVVHGDGREPLAGWVPGTADSTRHDVTLGGVPEPHRS